VQAAFVVPSIIFDRKIVIKGFSSDFFFMGKEKNVIIFKRNYAYHNDVTGPDMGLILIVQSFSDDYFYNIYNLMGFHVSQSKKEDTYLLNEMSQILIHNSKEYPDPSSGTAIQRFVSPGQEAFIRVDASSITSENDILGYKADKVSGRKFDVKNVNRKYSQRQCLFPHEKKSYNGKYTRSECLLNCKIRSVKALCDCIPFQLPAPPSYEHSTKICTLEHVTCLNKYKSM
jgi:acid-sensing ion channel, other